MGRQAGGWSRHERQGVHVHEVFSVLERQRDQIGPVLTNPTATRRAWIPGLVLLGLIVLLGGGLGYLVGNERQANTQTDQVHATWHTTRHHIAIAVGDLTVIRRELRADNRTIRVVGPVLVEDAAQVKAANWRGRVGPGSGQRVAAGDDDCRPPGLPGRRRAGPQRPVGRRS